MKNEKKKINIFQTLTKQNENIYKFNSTPIIFFLISKISIFLSFCLILMKISPNKISWFNFLVSITSILFIFYASIENNFINYGIYLYFFYLVIDFCDGTVARYFGITSFYGKFIDGLFDIFFKTFLILSLSFYGFEILGEKSILIFGCISSILTSFDTFVLDRYSAIVRWYNLEKKKSIEPYIKKLFLVKITFFYENIFVILIGLIIITKNETELFYYNLLVIYLITFMSALQNLILHIFYSYRNLKFKN